MSAGKDRSRELAASGMTIRAGNGTLRYLLALVLSIGGMTGGGYYAMQTRAGETGEELTRIKSQQESLCKELDRQAGELKEFIRLMTSVDSRLSRIEGRLDVLTQGKN